MIAPGEMEAQFSFKDYVSAFGAGVTVAGKSSFLPFLLLGTIGVISGQMRGLFAVASAYAGLHFVALPHWEERYFGVFYLAMGVSAATAAGVGQRRAEFRSVADW